MHWTLSGPILSDPLEQANKQVATNNKTYEFQCKSHSTSICHFHFISEYFLLQHELKSIHKRV